MITTKKMRLTAFGLLVSSAVLFNACSKDDDVKLDPIGGYNTSDDVAKTNLVAKWSFDGNSTESKTNLTATTVRNVTYVSGVKGSAYQGSDSSYTYSNGNPTMFAGLSSFTVSFWINTDQPTTPQGIWGLVDPTSDFGSFQVNLENFRNDTIKVKLVMKNVRSGVLWQGYGPQLVMPSATNKWVHVAFTYDAASSIISGYQNGVLGGTNSLDGLPYGPFNGSHAIWADNPGDANNINSAPLYGALQLPTSTKFLIGGFQRAINGGFGTYAPEPWSKWYLGKLDELRVYNKALNSTEINSLYQLELAGR